MKKRISNAFFLLTIIFGFVSPRDSAEESFEIKFPFYQDGRKWKKGYNGQDQLIALTEYILEGEAKDKSV